MQDWRRLGILFGVYLAFLTVLTMHGVGPIEAVTKIQLNTSDAQTVSNKTFDGTNTFNGTIGTGTYSGTQTFSALTANSVPLLNGSKQLISTANPTNGQLLIGSTGSTPVLGSLAGTTNQITVTPGAGIITLAGPQNLHTGASPTFNGLTLTNPLTVGNGGIGTNGTPTNGQLPIGNGSSFTLAALTGTANRVTVTNSAGGITLNGPQDLHTGASPTFAGATLTNLLDVSGASAGQVKFPATQNASTDANTLDDYEEGTWTPSVGGTATYVAQNGRYVKIGKLVTARCELVINTIGTGATTQIFGLPFTSAGTYHVPGSAYFFTLSTTVVTVVPMIDPSSTIITLYSAAAAASGVGANPIIGNSTTLYITVAYETA